VEINRCSSISAATTVRGEAQKYLVCLAMTLKDPQWRNEEEWRVLIIQPNNETQFARLTREDGVCYFELPLLMPGLVAEIVLGPQCGTDIARLKAQLTEAGLGDVAIRRAECQCEVSP
jgi:hypothetical protein